MTAPPVMSRISTVIQAAASEAKKTAAAATSCGVPSRFSGCWPAQAACWGTHLHAAAGDRLASRVGVVGFLARELLFELPLVLVELGA